jgi:hypothetical protein
VTDKSLLPAIETILSQPEQRDLIKENVTAFASISYRLSAHPSFPQDAETTPASQLRNASHPDHLVDVLSSIDFLQAIFGFGNTYILVGHSCGATLALQTIMRRHILGEEKFSGFRNPEAIVGVAGIYDIRLLCDCHENPAYNAFTVGAFGSDEELWDSVSPANFQGFKYAWPEGKALALVSSEGDELVDEKQIEVMIDRSQDLDGATKVEVMKDLKERHNDIWGKGAEMARVIDTVLKEYVSVRKVMGESSKP